MNSYKKLIARSAVILSILLLIACSPLQNKINQNLKSVNYSDGINKSEAQYIAEYYRLNNLTWVELVGPSDAGRYWSFKLTNKQGSGELKSPPVLVLKNAWSLKSAVRFDQGSY